MIVPNLMVSDMARSVRFYRDILGMTLTMTVSPEREVGWPGEAGGAAFAVLEWDGAQLMLQTVDSLAGELAVFAPDHALAPSGTIYFRGLHPGSVRDRVTEEDVVKGPEQSWYGTFFSFVFWKLEIRTRKLVKNAEDAIKYLDACYGIPDVDGQPSPLKLFTRDDFLTQRTKQRSALSHCSYYKCFVLVFAVIGILGVLGMVCGVTEILWTKPNLGLTPENHR